MRVYLSVFITVVLLIHANRGEDVIHGSIQGGESVTTSTGDTFIIGSFRGAAQVVIGSTLNLNSAPNDVNGIITRITSSQQRSWVVTMSSARNLAIGEINDELFIAAEVDSNTVIREETLGQNIASLTNNAGILVVALSNLQATTPTIKWTMLLNVKGAINALALTTTDIFAAGYYTESGTIGTFPVTSEGGRDMFMTAMSIADGSVSNVYSNELAGNRELRDVCIQGGRIFAVGSVEGDLGPPALQEPFLVRTDFTLSLPTIKSAQFASPRSSYVGVTCGSNAVVALVNSNELAEASIIVNIVPDTLDELWRETMENVHIQRVSATSDNNLFAVGTLVGNSGHLNLANVDIVATTPMAIGDTLVMASWSSINNPNSLVFADVIGAASTSFLAASFAGDVNAPTTAVLSSLYQGSLTLFGAAPRTPVSNLAITLDTFIFNDIDGDGITNDMDNCVAIPNANQNDLDQNGVGDVCDLDRDGDGIPNDMDSCPDNFDPFDADLDGDGIGDVCDPDIDGDSRPNQNDACPRNPDPFCGDVCPDALAPLLFQPQVFPSRPTVSITKSSSISLIEISVVGTYWVGGTYVIGFSPFDPSTRSINTPLSCENREASTFDGLAFEDWWKAEPSAIVDGALGTTINPAYGPGGVWSLSSSDCAEVEYKWTAGLFDLSGCTADGNTLQVTQFTSTNIEVTGVLYVNLVQPIDITDITRGEGVITHEYPFSLVFPTSMNAFGQLTLNSAALNILNETRLEDGRVQAFFETEIDLGQVLLNPTIVANSGPQVEVAATGVIDEGSLLRQQWSITSIGTSLAIDYSRTQYTILFDLQGSTHTVASFFTFSIGPQINISP